jgi:uncharacterized phage-like protein YoqJ
METNIQTDNFIILTISGGVGKNILATALVKSIKNKYPDMNIVVLTAWKEVWLYNPYIYRSYIFGQTPYFYETYIKGKENVKIFNIEPYSTEDYILQKKHLLDIWCDLYDLPKGETPELFFNQREVEYVHNNIIQNTPFMLLQSNGGANEKNKYSWVRDLPTNTAQLIANEMAKNIRVFHVRRDDQITLQNTTQFKGSIRQLFVLIRESNKRLFIDSMCQHAAKALNKSSVVCWVKNNPHVLGWDIHSNIVTDAVAELNTFDFSLLEPYNIEGDIIQCPFKEGSQLFDLDEIMECLNNQK